MFDKYNLFYYYNLKPLQLEGGFIYLYIYRYGRL